MSFTDPTADPVQPDSGQGDAGTPDSPYADYLSRIPEGVRGDVEPIFKEWDANTTRKFQEHSEYRKQWEPFEQLGVHQLAPDEVQWALQFRQAALENPQAIQEWYQGYADQHSLTPQQAQPGPAVEDLTYQDPAVEQLLNQRLESALSPLQKQFEEFSAWRAQQEEQARLAEATRLIEGQITELQQKHGDEFDRAMVERFLGNHLDSPKDAVRLAFEEYQSIRNAIEKAVLQGKVDAPAPPEPGGMPDVSPPRATSIQAVRDQAVEFLRNNNRA